MADPEYTAEEADSDFASGFTPQAAPANPAPASSPEPAATPGATPAPGKEEGTAPAATDTPAPAAPPEYIQITKSDWESVKSAADKTAGIEGQLAKVFGTVGNVKQIVDQLKAATPAGVAVELPADLLSEMEQEYPEFAKQLEGVLKKAFKGIRGTGTAAAPDTEARDKDWNARLKELSLEYQREALDDVHADWREIIGVSDAGPIPDTAFRKWLATQPTDYQAKINNTNSSAVLSRAIDKFQAATATPPPPPPPKPPAPKNTAQSDRFRNAVQPKGDGGQPGPTKTDDDAFNEGFRSG